MGLAASKTPSSRNGLAPRCPSPPPVQTAWSSHPHSRAPVLRTRPGCTPPVSAGRARHGCRATWSSGGGGGESVRGSRPRLHPRRLSRPGGTASSAWSGLRTRCPRDGRGCARGSFQRCRDVVRGPYTWDVFQMLPQGVRGNALQTRVGPRRPLAATRPWPGRHAPGLRGPSRPRTRATGRGHTGSARPPRFSPQTSSEQVPRPRCLGPHFLLFCAFCW